MAMKTAVRVTAPVDFATEAILVARALRASLADAAVERIQAELLAAAVTFAQLLMLHDMIRLFALILLALLALFLVLFFLFFRFDVLVAV